MIGATGTCSECQGKFRPGHLSSGRVCGTCEALLRLRLFVASGRCPGAIGGFIEERVRECHRLLLEEAERWWTAQSVPGSDPSGLQRVVKAPSPAGPPTASGGSRERRPVKESEKKKPKEEVPSPRRARKRKGRKSNIQSSSSSQEERAYHKEERKSKPQSPTERGSSQEIQRFKPPQEASRGGDPRPTRG